MTNVRPGWTVARLGLVRSARVWLVLGVLVAIGGGITLTAAAAARRTDTAVSRFLQHIDAPDLAVDLPPGHEADAPARLVAHLPGVGATSRSAGLFVARVDAAGKIDLPSLDQVLGSVDGRFLTTERPALSAGRLPDPSRAGEAFVTASTAEQPGLHLGDTVHLLALDERDPPTSSADAQRKGTPVDVHIVGVGTMSDEIVQDDITRDHRMVVTPAFVRAHIASESYSRLALHLERGAAGIGATETRIDRLAGSNGPRPAYEDEHDIAARAQRGIRPTALVLGLFAILAGLVTVLVVGQAISRQIRADAELLPTLRSLGFDRRQLAVAIGVPPLFAVIGGTMGAIGLAVALSPVGPVGVARPIEPHPGIAVDSLVLGLGAVCLVGLLLARCGASVGAAVLDAGRPSVHRAPASARLSAVFARLGPAASAGITLAFDRGQTRSSTARTTGVAIAVASAFLALALTFGAALHALVDQPRLYGWNWSSALQLGGGYGNVASGRPDGGPITAELLAGVPGVESASTVQYEKATIRGTTVPTLGVGPYIGHLDLVISSGRGLASDDEAVIGRTTASRLGLRIGDHAPLDVGSLHHRFLIVGTAIFPAIGRVDGERTGLGEGVELTVGGLAHLLPPDPSQPSGSGGANAVVIRYRPGADDARVTRLLRARFAGTFSDSKLVGPQRSAELVDYRNLGRAPGLLVGFLALAAAGTLVQALASTVRRHRHDLGLLKALGFTRRQVFRSVAWQATAMTLAAVVVAFPLGTAAGRVLWSLYARQLGVLSEPVTPAALLLLAAAATLVMANLVAAIPASVAARLRPAESLRAG